MTATHHTDDHAGDHAGDHAARSALHPPGATEVTCAVNGVGLVCLVDDSAGADAPLALCLHGFPDTALTWRYLMPRLAAAGYRAVAPYLRGYAPSAVPPDGRYQTAAVSQDANALHEAFGGDGRAVIIGHDWGAPATYGAAVTEPERWSRVVAMAVPPGPAMAAALFGNLDQLKRSWYMFLFQHPLSDAIVAGNDLAFIDMIWQDWSPGYDAGADTAAVKAALGSEANLAAALGYYRAALGDGYRDPDLEDRQAATQQIPNQPSLYLHGRNDGCIGIEVAHAAEAMCADSANVNFAYLDDVGHFAHLEAPDTVGDLIIDFLTDTATTTP
jgi:pimeloyl-ACP methyl ester carboxylesterase